MVGWADSPAGQAYAARVSSPEYAAARAAQTAAAYAPATPAPAPAPAAVPTASGPATGPNATLFAQIQGLLNDMGLNGLFSVGADGTPSGWAWDQITSGVDSVAAMGVNLESTTQWQQRYGVIKDLRAQALTNPSVHVPNEAAVREYEQTVSNSMRQAGLPSFMYDNYTDMHDLMKQGLSAVEVEQRLGQSWAQVQNTDPAVRQAFGSFFGAQGDAALASMFLDPTKTQASLDRMARTAYTAGIGSRMGVNIDQATADRVAGSPLSDAGITQDLTQISALQGSGVFTPTLSDTEQLAAETTGANAVFFGSGSDANAIEKRRIERATSGTGSTGGALRTNKGLTGAGSTLGQ